MIFMICSHEELHHMDHMRRPIGYGETKSVLRSQLYPILDDKDSLYLKLNLVLERTICMIYAADPMYHT